MVQHILKIFYKEFTSVNQAALLLGLFTFISQILGLVRDRIFASQIGVGLELDIYYTAFRIPDIVFAVAASLVAATILMPFFVSAQSKDTYGHDVSQKFLTNIFSAFSLGMIAISLLVFLLMPVLAQWVAPGFDETATRELIKLSRLMLLSPFLLGVSNLIGTITQASRKFFIHASAPILYNFGIILGAFFLYPVLGITGLVYGVILGALFHIIIQIPVLLQQEYRLAFTCNIDWKHVWEVLSVSLPRTFTLSINKIVMAVLIALASKLVAGSVSIFNFAWNLQNVPLALIGLSFSVAAFPTLVDYFTKHDHENFLKQIIAPARQIIFWSIPVVIFFIVLRAHIVRVILGAGEFSWNDTRLTAAALALFVVSVTFQSLVLLLVRGYYAAGKTWRPFIITCMSGCISIGSAFLFLHLFQTQEGVRVFIESLLRVSGVPGTSVLMLGLAYTLGEALRFFIMWFLFKKEFMRGYSMSLQKVFLQTLTASVFMGGVIYQLLQLFNTVLDINTFHGVFLQGFLSGSIGLCVFILVLKILKNEEIEAIEHALRAKGFWRVPFMGGGKDALS